MSPTTTAPSSLRWSSAAVVAWMVAFAAVHVYWLFDGRVGLPAGRSVYDRPALLIIDIVAIPLCLAGALLGRSLVWAPDRRPTVRWRRRLITATAVVLTVHVLPVVPTWLTLLTGGDPDLTDDERFIALLYEPVFLSGGLVCAAAAVALRRSIGSGRHRSPVPVTSGHGA